MVNDYDEIVHGIVNIIWVMHALMMISTHKMYYSLCWTQRCTIQYHMVREGVAARDCKNSAFWVHFWPSIGWLLPIVDFIINQQHSTQWHSFAWIQTVFHHYSDGNQSTINQILGICQAKIFNCRKYSLFDYWWFLFKDVCLLTFFAIHFKLLKCKHFPGLHFVGGDVGLGVVAIVGQSIGGVVGRGVSRNVGARCRACYDQWHSQWLWAKLLVLQLGTPWLMQLCGSLVSWAIPLVVQWETLWGLQGTESGTLSALFCI